MSVCFQDDLHITNGAAYKLLKHLGYDMGMDCAGSMPLDEMRGRIDRAKAEHTEHPPFFLELDELCAELALAGVEVLEWS
jgi:hypothetical protein